MENVRVEAGCEIGTRRRPGKWIFGTNCPHNPHPCAKAESLGTSLALDDTWKCLALSSGCTGTRDKVRVLGRLLCLGPLSHVNIESAKIK